MKYPGATFVGANKQDYSANPISHKFVIIHVMQGSETGTCAWFNNPNAQVSAHFGVSKNGLVQQYVDTDEMAWAEGQWNGIGISIEHEGLSGQHLTKAQIKADKKLLRWLRKQYALDLRMTFNPHDARGGVIPHGKLPEGSLSHPDCPGQPIIDDVHRLLNSLRSPLKRVLGLHYQRPLVSLSDQIEQFLQGIMVA